MERPWRPWRIAVIAVTSAIVLIVAAGAVFVASFDPNSL